MTETEVKKIPMMDLVEGWESRRIGRDKAVFFHVGSGVKFNVNIINGSYLVTPKSPENNGTASINKNSVDWFRKQEIKEMHLENEFELKKFLFKMMCLIDNYSI